MAVVNSNGLACPRTNSPAQIARDALRDAVRVEPPADWCAFEDVVRLAVGVLGFDTAGLVADLERPREADGLDNAHEQLQILLAGGTALEVVAGRVQEAATRLVAVDAEAA